MKGILLINKPILYTSHDIVDIVRRKLGIKRVGHAGTLDPMATGLLILLIGDCTKLFDSLSAEDKYYDGMMTLGYSTKTQDCEGVITDARDASHITSKDIETVFQEFTGKLEQRVPQYSSAKIKGRKAYELARKDQVFETPVKTVEIHALNLEGFNNPDVFFSTHVSKGTYLRAIASDVGDKLGVGMMLSSLRRTGSGEFHLDGALEMADFLSKDLRSIADLMDSNLKKHHEKQILVP
jgi:tRNA pseudouridine55 synthase